MSEHGPFDGAELKRWAEMYGDPEGWVKRAQAAHGRAERAQATLHSCQERERVLREASEELRDAFVAASEHLRRASTWIVDHDRHLKIRRAHERADAAITTWDALSDPHRGGDRERKAA